MRLSHLEELQYFEDKAEELPRWYADTLIRVMDGESLKDIAEGYACHGVVLLEWIRRDPNRLEAYEEALEKKREMIAEELVSRTARAAFATVQDAQNASGEWLEIQSWPKGLLAAADSAEFGPDGRVFKIKMDAGKAADRLAKLMGMDKSQQPQVNLSMSLIGLLSDMPAAPRRLKPGEVAEAEVVPPKQIQAVPVDI